MSNTSHKDVAIGFLMLVAQGRVQQAFDQHIAPGFRHHNPHFRGDAAALKEAMLENARENPHKVLDVQRALQDGDQVAVMSHIRQRSGELGAAVVHICRFEGDRIVEMWDVGQAVPAQSANENGMF